MNFIIIIIGNSKVKEKVVIDSESENTDLWSTTVPSTSGSVDGYISHEKRASPVWLSARAKLQRYAFQKADSNRRKSTPDADQKNVFSSNGERARWESCQNE